MDITCIADVKALLGEGPHWNAETGQLSFVDIKGRKLFLLDADGGNLRTVPTPYRIGSLIPRATGGHIAGTEHGIAHVDLDRERFELLFDPEEDRESNRFNDAKVDRKGRLFAGTMDDEEKKAIGRILPDRQATCLHPDRRRLPGHQWPGLQPRRQDHVCQ